MSRQKILILAGVMLLFILVELLLPKPLNWTPTYSHRDKNPYGAYVLGQLLPGFFTEAAPRINAETLYENQNLPQPHNLLILCDQFDPEQEDLKVLLQRVQAGDQAFIAAHYWGTAWADTLEITYNYSFNYEAQIDQTPDSLWLRFTQKELAQHKIRIPGHLVTTTFDSLPPTATVLAQIDGGKPVFIALPWQEGTLYLSSTPLLFTNYFLMQPKARSFAEAALGYLPSLPLLWTEYYHLGRFESPSPLRFILREPALRWSYYLGIGVLLSFVLFNLKRRQRAIPVVAPPANTSLQFAETVSRLYYSQGNHLDIAQKKIIYFMEWLREHYHMPAGAPDEAYISRLVQKSGKPEAEVRALFLYLQQLQGQPQLSACELLVLQKKIESFTRK